jgi:hypothetical protein
MTDGAQGDKTVVISIFPDEAAADSAVDGLKSWAKDFKDVDLSAFGVLALDGNGKLKEHKMGSHSTAKGAGIGLVLAAIFPPTLLAGAVGGGILGRLHHKNLGVTQDEQEHLVGELQGGKAAVAVLSSAVDEPVIAAQLESLGGTPEEVSVTPQAIADADAAVAAAPASADAAVADAAAPAAEAASSEASTDASAAMAEGSAAEQTAAADGAPTS